MRPPIVCATPYVDIAKFPSIRAPHPCTLTSSMDLDYPNSKPFVLSTKTRQFATSLSQLYGQARLFSAYFLPFFIS